MKSLLKRISVITTICLILFSICFLSACKDKGTTKNQITIEQIHLALNSYGDLNSIDGDEEMFEASPNGVAELIVEWTYEIEKQNINIDTQKDLLIATKFTYRTDELSSKYYYVNIIKFSDEKAAIVMIKDFDFEEDVNAKRYGHLVVVINDEIQEEVFSIIDSIK